MIKKLTFSGFRGQSKSYEFGDANSISGRNGVGKSSIKEAVCITFAGTDSAGNRVPLHLISLDADKLKVEAETNKALLTRTLTKKKNGTLTLEKGEISRTLTAQELENMLCSPELFLSVFVPGAFMRFPAKTKHAVLNSVLTRLDRRALLQEMCGVDLSQHAYEKITYNRRPDLIAMDFAAMRRMKQGHLDHNTGAIAGLKAPARCTEPTIPEECAMLPHLRQEYEAWSRYHVACSLYSERQRAVTAAQEENARRAAAKAQLQKELSEEQLNEVPTELDISGDMAALEAQKKVLPAEPLQLTVVESDHCPACGQVVGEKHREYVREENHKVVEAYKAVCTEVNEHNLQIRFKVDLLKASKEKNQAAVKRVVEKNQQLDLRRARLETKIKDLVDMAVPAGLEEPTRPAYGEVTAELVDKVRNVVKAYEKEKAQFDFYVQQTNEAAEKIGLLEKDSALLTNQINELQHIEDCVKQLPAREFAMREELLTLPGYKFVVDDDISLIDSRGIPYALLSCAEQTAADVMVSLKLNELMPRKVGMIFVDNAELLDGNTKQFIMEECSKQAMQLFFVYVDTAVPDVTVSVL